jgi:hypothetical protein
MAIRPPLRVKSSKTSGDYVLSLKRAFDGLGVLGTAVAAGFRLISSYLRVRLVTTGLEADGSHPAAWGCRGSCRCKCVQDFKNAFLKYRWEIPPSLRSPVGMFGNERFDLPVHLIQPALQEANSGIHVTLRRAHTRQPPIAFRDEHFNELPVRHFSAPSVRQDFGLVSVDRGRFS